MSNLVNHARRELELLIPPDSIPGDPGYEVGDDGEPDPLNALAEYLRAALLQLVTVFADQHHSDMSSSYVIRVLPDLLDFKNLTPLTDNPDEWNEVCDGLWQSARCRDAFSQDGGKTYYLLSDEIDSEVTKWHKSEKASEA